VERLALVLSRRLRSSHVRGRASDFPGAHGALSAKAGLRSSADRAGRHASPLPATFEAISAEREPGSDLFAVLVAQDQRAALRTSFRYASAPFEASAILKRSIVSQTADTLA
jgi:hypothetical protein